MMVALWSTVILMNAVLDSVLMGFMQEYSTTTQGIILLASFGVLIVLLLAWQWWLKKHSPRTVRSQQPKSADMNQRLVLTNKITKRGWWTFVLMGLYFYIFAVLGEYFTHGRLFAWWKLGIMAISGVLFVFVMWLLGWRIYAKNTYTIEGNMLYIHEYEIHHTTDLQIPLADIDSVQFFWTIYGMGSVKMVVNGNLITLKSGFCAQELYTALSQRI